jgi:hypothetical protein
MESLRRVGSGALGAQSSQTFRLGISQVQSCATAITTSTVEKRVRQYMLHLGAKRCKHAEYKRVYVVGKPLSSRFSTRLWICEHSITIRSRLRVS